jgi:hypothetical protein
MKKNENQQQSKSDSYPHSKSQNMEKNELRDWEGFVLVVGRRGEMG